MNQLSIMLSKKLESNGLYLKGNIENDIKKL